MHLLTKETKWKPWQLSIIKISAASFGALLAIYFTEFFKQISWLIWILFLIPGIYASYVWLKQMK